MGHDHSMQNSHYVPFHRIIAKSLLSTSFSIACPSASEQQVYLNDPRSNIGNCFQILVIGSAIYRLGIMTIKLKEYKKN